MGMSKWGGMACGLVYLLAPVCAGAVSDPKENTLEQGAEDFRVYCASCHGSDARGGGPVAPFLVRKPADLTTLSARNGGVFPTDGVYWVIDGRGDVAAHGPREMPVWGLQFGGPEASEAMTRERILAIIEYLKSLQSGTPANEAPGD